MHVILDCGLCVLKGFVKLRKRLIVSCDVIKKRRYWTSMVPGKDMEDHFGEWNWGEIFHTGDS